MKILGLDIGTSNIKGILFDEKGNEIFSKSINVSVIIKSGGKREQDVASLFSKTIKLINQIQKESLSHIDGISISAAMHSFILIDSNNDLLSNSIIWADTRSQNVLEQLLKYNKKIHDLSGVPVHPMSWIGKALWFQKNKTEIWAKTKRVVSFKEYLIFQMSGEWLVDYSIAASSGMLNLKTLEWDPFILKVTNIKKEMLSKVVPTTFKVKVNNKNLLKEFKNEFEIIVGSSDGCLANIGSGVLNQNDVAISVGTSSAVRTTINEAWIDEKNRIFCYPIFKNKFIIGGASNNAGNVIEWYQKLRNNLSFENFWKEFNLSTPGAKGIIFHPYINGERAPYWDSRAKGGFFNLETNCDNHDLTRAVAEGITYAISTIALVLEEKIKTINNVILTGGILKSETWIQLLADVLNVNIIIQTSSESTCMGAAFLGFMAFGLYTNISDITNWIKIKKIIKPNVKDSSIYAKQISNFIYTYYKLKS